MLRVTRAKDGDVVGVVSSLSAAMQLIATELKDKEDIGISIDWTGISLVFYVHSKTSTQIYRIRDEQENAENPS